MNRISLYSMLFELFDTEKNVQWEKLPGDSFIATLEAPNSVTYEIKFYSLSDSGMSDEFDNTALDFMSQETLDSFSNQGYEVSFRDKEGRQTITGTGGRQTVKVLAMIVNAIISKVAKENIGYFFFTAEEPSRKSLYKKIVPMIANKLGYEYATDGTYFFVSSDPLEV